MPLIGQLNNPECIGISKMDYSDLTETDAFYDSCRTRALHDFNDVLEQSLELSSDVMDALVRNKLISNHVRDMLNGVRAR